MGVLQLLLPAVAMSDPPRDGTILAREACTESRSGYDAYRQRIAEQWRADDAAARSQGLVLRPLEAFLGTALSEGEYEARKNRLGYRCERIVYASDGLRVVAFFWRPDAVTPDSGRLPLIVFNRGGYGEESKLRPNTWFGFHNYLAAGYAVLGSQYRGNDGGEGVDEMGGADLRDVLALPALARELGFPQATPTYALGFSRGGLMTLLALHRGLDVRAAAVMGTPVDLTRVRDDPARRSALAKRIPRFEADPDGALRERSPLFNLDGLGTPVLVLHGTADAMVPVRDALRLADELLARRVPTSLVLYDGDSHGLALNGRDRDERIMQWFRAH
jgi:dipeptidyl aminopeptidase/acylaminoacyl peptidase